MPDTLCRMLWWGMPMMAPLERGQFEMVSKPEKARPKLLLPWYPMLFPVTLSLLP